MRVMYTSVRIPCLKKYSIETLSLKQTEDSFVTVPILTLSLCPLFLVLQDHVLPPSLSE